MRSVLISILTAFAITVGGCALLSSETTNDCLAVGPMYDEFIDTKGVTPTTAEIGAQIDLCLAGLEKDSKAFELAIKVLKQALKDAWDDFRGGILVQLTMSNEDYARAAIARAQLELQLDGYSK